VRWEIKQSFDNQLYQVYSYQNLLQLDHFSSSYDEQNFGVFLCPTVYEYKALVMTFDRAPTTMGEVPVVSISTAQPFITVGE